MEENRAENQTPRRQHTQHPTHQAHKKKKSGTAKTVIGTILAIGLTTCLMFFAIFMVYVHTSLDLNVDISAYTLKQSSTVYYQDKTSGEWVELTKLHGVENRTLVSIDDIPKHVQEALIWTSALKATTAWTGRARREPFSASSPVPRRAAARRSPSRS